MKKLLKNKKALSPVVAAIILIAVTVAVSIAVAAWMGSMTFTFMETEELRITSVGFATDGSVTVNVQNIGTSDVFISSATINGAVLTIDDNTPVTVGEGVGLPINCTATSLNAGQSYNIQLLSSKGNNFAFTAVSSASTS